MVRKSSTERSRTSLSRLKMVKRMSSRASRWGTMALPKRSLASGEGERISRMRSVWPPSRSFRVVSRVTLW